MGIPVGPWYIDDLLTFTVNTHRVDTGVATDADAVPSYRVYEDETGTPILTGNTAKLDDANTTGFYSEQLTLSAANGFEVGKSYSIYVAATVNSIAATQSYNFKVVATPPTAADVAAIKAKTDNLPSDPADASDITAAFAAILTTQMTESYAADGTAPTAAQALFLIQQLLSEFAISGTTMTVKKINGSTTAATLTLDSATSPTSITRAT